MVTTTTHTLTGLLTLGHQVLAMAASEVTSLEQLLGTAGERPLDARELSEVKRILYGNPSK